jgi:hypothetical protein
MADFDEFAGLQNDEHILRMLANLQQRLGPGSFQTVDHSEADLRAVGIATLAMNIYLRMSLTRTQRTAST